MATQGRVKDKTRQYAECRAQRENLPAKFKDAGFQKLDNERAITAMKEVTRRSKPEEGQRWKWC